MINRWLWIGLSLFITVGVIAQEATCPTLQLDALNAIEEFCAEQSMDTLCYGHPTLSLTSNDVADDSARFALPGDTIPLTSIDWFSTSTEADTWGTTRAFMQAYPTNSFDAQSATMILFGNVILFNQGIENISVQTQAIEVNISQGANVRALPSTDSQVVEPVLRGTILKASGISDDSAWVRVHLDRETVGWVTVTAVTDDYVGLPTVSAEDEVEDLILPLQAFNFQSGIGDAPCDGVPSSGILLQTSNPEESLEFYINDVTLQLAGTAFLQAQPEAGLLVHILDGTGNIIALGDEQMVNAGYVSRIFLDTNDDDELFPIETPSIPLVYDYQNLINLPINLLPIPARVGIDIYTLITPRPVSGNSPIAGMALGAPCKFTVGQSGANIRSAPDPNASIIAVMGYRESAEPIARAIGEDGLPWWKLAEKVWIRIDTTVTGGDCTSVPTIQFEG